MGGVDESDAHWSVQRITQSSCHLQAVLDGAIITRSCAAQLDGVVPAQSRRSEDLIDALKRRGATVLHAPTLKMADRFDDGPILADTRTMIDARPGVLLATTSYGIRRWFEVADADGIGDELLEALKNTTILVRGPKARGGYGPPVLTTPA
jgi:hypothetical protein